MTGETLLVLRVLLGAVLYGFLGWGIFVIWRDLRQQGQVVSARQIPPLELRWEQDGEPQSRSYDTPEITLGRDPACDCAILNETVSARHARLAYHHSQWWIEDLQSTNGTYINQEQVYTPTVIVSGDELRCGQVHLQVSLAERVGIR
jgi:pSer/pThr/pTyr-binding forkhead associated (FHA) protein